MSELLGVSVAELLALLRERGEPIPSEIGAFIVLRATERILDRPALLAPDVVYVTEGGIVSVHPSASTAGDAEAARSAQELLAHLLVRSSAAAPRALFNLLERGPGDGVERLARLRDELEASLLPLNRESSQRALARLARKSRLGAHAPSDAPAFDAEELDAELDALLATLGSAPAAVLAPPAAMPVPPAPPAAMPMPPAPPAAMPVPPAPPAAMPVPPAPPAETPAPAVLTSPAPPPTAQTPIASSASAPTATPIPAERAAPALAATTAKGGPRPRMRFSLTDEYETRRPRGGSRQNLVFALIFVALVVGAAAFVFDGLGYLAADELSAREAAEAAARVEPAPPPAEAAAPRYGDLVVRVPRDRAQVLMRVGHGPAVATNLPVGIAHEFVAVAPGRVPTRAVVPPDAEWKPTKEGPRYELALRTRAAQKPAEELELGETLLPREVGANRNQLGSVRVRTSPEGAEVFLLIGFAPETRVRDLRADQTYELLVWAEGFAAERVSVTPEDFREGARGRTAEVDVRLESQRAQRR